MTTFSIPPAPTPAVPPVPVPETVEVTLPPVPSETASTASVPPIVTLSEVVHAPEPAPATPSQGEPASAVADSVRALAERRGVDLATVTPTGRGGKITRKDVENAAAAKDSVTGPAADAQPATTPEGSAGPTVTLTLRLTARDGHPVRVSGAEDILALASAHLPQLQVVGAALELTSEGTVLLAEITTTLEVQL